MNSMIHSLSDFCLFIYIFIFINSLIFIHLDSIVFLYLFIFTFLFEFLYLFIYLFIYLLIYLFIYLLIYLFICLFVYLFILRDSNGESRPYNRFKKRSTAVQWPVRYIVWSWKFEKNKNCRNPKVNENKNHLHYLS